VEKLELVVKIIIIIVYLAIVAFLGFLGWRRTKNASDFLLGGRKIHPTVMALSYGATFISTSAIVGFGGYAGVFGMSLLWLTFLNIFLGIFIAFIFFGKRTRHIGRNLDAHTFPELLGKRFNSKFIQKFAGVVIFIFMPVYTAAVMIGVSQILATGLGLNYELALALFAVIVAAYVIFGGLKGVMYSDAFQGTLMLVGMVALIIIVYSKLGGVTQAHQALTDLIKNPAVAEQTAGMQAGGFMGWTSMPKLFSNNWMTVMTSIVAGVGIGVLAQPQLAVRFMTVKSDREINRAVPIGGVFILLMTGVAFVVGALSNVLFINEGYVNPETGEVVKSIAAVLGTDNIIPMFLKTFTEPWFVTIFMVVLMAAGMSTISSQFHAMGTAAGRDIVDTSKSTNQKGMLVTRLGTLIAIILTVILSYVLPKIWDGAIAIATGLFFGLCGAAFLPLFVGALYSKKMTKAAAISGMVAGASASMLWMLLFHVKEAKVFGLVNAILGTAEAPVHSLSSIPVIQNLDPLFIGLPIAIIVTIIVQIASKKKLEAAHVDTCFDGVGKSAKAS
jgi:SSS family solute:Na+ symporter